MRRSFDIDEATFLYVEPPQEVCASCGNNLWICEHAKRIVQRLDGVYCLVRQNKWCPVEGCERFHKIVRVPQDLRFALPRYNYGLDVVLEVGERHLRSGDALRRITRELNERMVPLSQRNSCRLFRAYVALTKLARGDDTKLRERLLAQGGIVLMADGVQFDSTSPVLYLVWDAISGEPLFGERKAYRGAEDLVPLLQRVEALEVPVIGAVSDKEKGLLPAVAQVFPDVPHQLCQLHFLKNCALGMAADLQELGQGVSRRAEKVRKLAKKLHETGWDSIEHDRSIGQVSADPHRQQELTKTQSTPMADVQNSNGSMVPCAVLPEDGTRVASARDVKSGDDASAPLGEEQLATELCAMARHAARATGRAPLNPPEHVRNHRMEAIRKTVEEALKKGGGTQFSRRFSRR
ncbi:MAG: transposase [Candidatus Krumholzibacteriia bacterium]